jgi:hypothetical protein
MRCRSDAAGRLSASAPVRAAGLGAGVVVLVVVMVVPVPVAIGIGAVVADATVDGGAILVTWLADC